MNVWCHKCKKPVGEDDRFRLLPGAKQNVEHLDCEHPELELRDANPNAKEYIPLSTGGKY